MAYVQISTPEDFGVLSCLEFGQALDTLLIASHSRVALLYSCQSHGVSPLYNLTAEVKTPSPIMAVAHSDHSSYAGCLDGTLRQFDYENTRMTSPLTTATIDQHPSSPINYVRSVDPNLIIYTTIDGSIKYFDPRMSRLVDSYTCPAKLFAMDASPRTLTVGLSGSQVQLFDLRNRSNPWQSRGSGLRYQMSCIRNFPSGEGFALSSIDGRVSIEYNDLLEEVQQKKFAFKCHRVPDHDEGVDKVYPVTGLRFHKQYNTLFTAGGDGHVCVWNWEKRKRMKQFPKVPGTDGISQLDINNTGSLMAVGTTDDGFMRLPDTNSSFVPRQSQVFLRRLDEIDCKPKPK